MGNVSVIARENSRWRSPIRLGLSLLGLLMLGTVYATGGPGYDFMAYWAVDPSSPYATAIGFGAFHYAPPFAYVAGPLSWLPFDAAYVVWTGSMVALLIWMTRSWALAWCSFPPVASELYHGNMHIAMAALIVVGLRYSPAFAALGLAKVTTGVGMLWPLCRRDWRGVAAASAALVAVVIVSVLLQGPGVWLAWFEHLALRAETAHVGGALIDVPLILRLPIAIGLVVWGATSGRPWILPIAVALATPLLWLHSLAVLVALPSTLRWRESIANDIEDANGSAVTDASHARAGLMGLRAKAHHVRRV